MRASEIRTQRLDVGQTREKRGEDVSEMGCEGAGNVFELLLPEIPKENPIVRIRQREVRIKKTLGNSCVEISLRFGHPSYGYPSCYCEAREQS